MINYYICLIFGFIMGYFIACLMMMAKGNTKVDMDVHSWRNNEIKVMGEENE